MLQKIAIKMLGDFSVVADGRCVVDATAKLTKPWQLFCYLALNREHVTRCCCRSCGAARSWRTRPTC